MFYNDLDYRVIGNRITQVNWSETGFFQAYVDNSTWIDIITYSKLIENIDSRAVVKESYLNAGTDLNTVTKSGFYRLNTGHVNAPNSIGVESDWSQMIVVRGGGDTIAQILINYSTSKMAVRSGNPPECGGAGSWTNWVRMIDANCYVYDSSTNSLTINI